MSSPVGHLVAAAGMYVAATAPKSTAKLRGAGTLALVAAMALLPDLLQILARTGAGAVAGKAGTWDVAAIMHGLAFGLVVSAALAGAIPGMREGFWGALLVLFSGHLSHTLLDWMTAGGTPLFAPFDWTARRSGLWILPSADARILSSPFVSAVKIMAVEAAILLPCAWTAWILGREGGEARSRPLLVLYAISWPLAAGLAFWVYKSGGRV